MNSNMRKMYTEEQIAKLGGTKLYKHIVTNSDDNQIIIITVHKERLESYSEIKTLFDSGLIISGWIQSNLNGSGILLSCYNALFWYFDGDTETISSIDGEADINDDVVTPL